MVGTSSTSSNHNITTFSSRYSTSNILNNKGPISIWNSSTTTKTLPRQGTTLTLVTPTTTITSSGPLTPPLPPRRRRSNSKSLLMSRSNPKERMLNWSRVTTKSQAKKVDFFSPPSFTLKMFAVCCQTCSSRDGRYLAVGCARSRPILWKKFGEKKHILVWC